MKIPFLSAKAEQVVNKAVDIAGEKVSKAVNAAKDDKLLTAAILLPICATAYIMFTGDRGTIKTPDVPNEIIIINNYYYGSGKEN